MPAFGSAIDGDDLMLEADAAPPAAVLDLLSRHKAGVIALLRTGSDGWSAEDWRAFFDERAGIAEFDGGLPRDRGRGPRLRLLRRRMAEPQSGALAAGPLPRLRRTRARPRRRCCRSAPNRPAMPGCIRAAGPPGTQARKAEAVAALAAIGIEHEDIAMSAKKPATRRRRRPWSPTIPTIGRAR